MLEFASVAKNNNIKIMQYLDSCRFVRFVVKTSSLFFFFFVPLCVLCLPVLCLPVRCTQTARRQVAKTLSYSLRSLRLCAKKNLLFPRVYTRGYTLSLLQSSLYELRLTKAGAIHQNFNTYYPILS